LPPLAGRLTSSVKCAFQFQRAEYLPEGGIFHRGDVDTTPFAVTSGDMTPESSESGINLRCGDICAQNARMTTGALQRLRKVKNRKDHKVDSLW
jgi:hypothetical protein